MRILVTGATGFLGGHLVRRLLNRGDTVIAVGRNADRLETLAQAGADTIAHDISVAPLPPTGRVDACVHAAALSSPWGPEQAFQLANVDGTRHVLASARASGSRRFVHISTPSVYFRFTDQLDVREDLPLGEPVNSYARTKRQAERLVLAETTLDPILLRPRGLYGAGDTALLPRLLKAAASRALPLLRDGAAVTDLTHVDDVVSAVEAALDLPPMPNAGPERRVFNISGGQPLAIREIVEAAAVRTGLSIRWRPLPVSLALGAARVSETICRLLPNRPEPPVTAYGIGIFAFSQTLDLSAARDTLGWSPRIDFQTGLERTFTPVSP